MLFFDFFFFNFNKSIMSSQKYVISLQKKFKIAQNVFEGKWVTEGGGHLGKS